VSVPARKKRVGLVSLGCPKNQVDAEVMLGRLVDEGWEVTADVGEADAIVVNTCGFIEAAKQESLEAIFEASRALAGRSDARLVVTGCLAQRYPHELAAELPEVAAFVPLGDVDTLAAAVRGAGPRVPSFPQAYGATFLDDATARRVLTSSAGSAYVKISEGCDHECSFCAIPSMRGRHRSRPEGDVVREVESLAARGVREVVLVAQDSSAYGRDRGERHALARLLGRLDAVKGLAWIRVMYAYPATLDEATLEAIASLPRVVKYLDLPLQHASARVLAAMRRGGNATSLRRLLDRARAVVPDLVVRSTFIVGFPEETEAELEELRAFVAAAELDHVGVFTYSRQDGTTAHPLGDPVPEQVKEQRRAGLMAVQAGTSLRRNRARVGRIVEVLVEGAHPETEHLLVGRWWGQAPEVDGTAIIASGVAPRGAVVPAEVVEAHDHDLVVHLAGVA
jgi:ribosomal protein S12 methylthiotransferase